MRNPGSSLTRSRLWRPVLLTAAAAMLSTAFMTTAAGSVTASPVVVSGTSHGWVFHDGETVSVSMGANKLFPPNSRVNILECSDGARSKQKLPTRFGQCDENSIQGNTVLVGKGGAFKESSYPIYSLPNSLLGEQGNWQPVCNKTHPCVLLISEYQTDFTKPKTFSHAFFVTPSTTKSQP